ncbi:MAG: glycosyltransferase family 39 protein [Solirubrobacterales bacterium]|nr:glycosyltransferase family 39 protein [Solirubrobacterales bacterium]
MKANFAEWRSDAGAWLRERGLEIWIITGIWAILTVIIYLLATGHESPRRYQDEFLFWALAKNWAGGDGLTWRGTGLQMRSALYPILLAPAFWFANSVPGQYTGVHLISSMMIVATIFPAYLMGRLYMDRWRALVVALLVVSVPAMNYAGVIGTENLGYLLFTAACGGILLSLARPRPRNTLLAFALVLAAMLSRTQFIVLLPIFTGTLLMAAVMGPPGNRVDYLKERRSVWTTLVALAALGGLFILVQGKGAFGLYGGVFEGIPLEFSALWFWVKAFTADVYLLSAIVPVIATLAMFGRAENRRDPLIGALLALAVIASIVFIAQISWFSATNPYQWRARHIFYERYMFYLGPIFFLGFLASWKRVSWTSALVSVAVATAIISGFQTDAVLVPFSYDSFGLTTIASWMANNPASAPKIGMLLARLTFLLGVVYVLSTIDHKLVRKILYCVLVAVTFVWLIQAQAKTWQDARKYSAQAFELVPKPANFIDQNTDEEVGMIITSTDDPLSYFTTEFWNNRVVRAFATDAKPIVSPIMYSPKCKFDWTRTGEILGTGCDLVPNAWYLRSDTVAMHLKDETKRVNPSPAWPTMTLMVGGAPPRMLSLIDGRNVRSGIVSGALNTRTFLDKPGKLRFKIRGSESTAVLRTPSGKSVVVQPGKSGELTMDLSANETYSTFTVKTPGGIQSEVFLDDLSVQEPDGKWQSIL